MDSVVQSEINSTVVLGTPGPISKGVYGPDEAVTQAHSSDRPAMIIKKLLHFLLNLFSSILCSPEGRKNAQYAFRDQKWRGTVTPLQVQYYNFILSVAPPFSARAEPHRTLNTLLPMGKVGGVV